jgi:hypothetical protein
MSFTFRLSLPQFATGLAMIKPQPGQACTGRGELLNRFIHKSVRFKQTLAAISLALELR